MFGLLEELQRLMRAQLFSAAIFGACRLILVIETSAVLLSLPVRFKWLLLSQRIVLSKPKYKHACLDSPGQEQGAPFPRVPLARMLKDACEAARNGCHVCRFKSEGKNPKTTPRREAGLGLARKQLRDWLGALSYQYFLWRKVGVYMHR